MLYFVAVGNVRGFAFTLGLTAIADLVVVFLFTHPVLRLLARTKFFGEGHPLSGLDPRRLGGIPLYRGAGRLRDPNEKPVVVDRARNKGAEGEAGRRMTIAERRRAEQQKALAGGGGGEERPDRPAPPRTGSSVAGRTGSSQKETNE